MHIKNGDFKLFNSISGQVEQFILKDDILKMYVCGPTVYDSPHIGNARSFIVFDILYRILQFIYPNVIYTRNITDIDDKIINKSISSNTTIQEVTNQATQAFHNDLKTLQILQVTNEPKVTDHIQEMIDIITLLVRNGAAYISENHVLYDVTKNPEYGILSNRKLEDMQAGARVEVENYKKYPLDFVLWKPCDKDGWDSPWGYGRPAWNCECPALIYATMGSHIDIHGGGCDLIFPHHENECAIMKSAFNSKLANYWIHNEMLVVNNQKMSKSVGNIIYVKDLIEKNISSEIIRYIFLSTHYQKTVNWTDNAVATAEKSLYKLYLALENLNYNFLKHFFAQTDDPTTANNNNDPYGYNFLSTTNLQPMFTKKHLSDNHQSTIYQFISTGMIEALCDNMNTHEALRCLTKLADTILKCNEPNEKEKFQQQLFLSGRFLGFFFEYENLRNDIVFDEQITKLIEQRTTAKIEKNYQKSDEIRKQLLDLGIMLEDLPNNQVRIFNKKIK